MNTRSLASACATFLCTVGLQLPLQAQQKPTIIANAAPSEPVSFDIFLPHQHREALEQLLTELHTPGSARYHQWLTPAQFQQQFGVAPEQVKAIESELSGYGLTATQSSPHRVHVTGTAAAVQAAFATPLQHALKPNGRELLVASSALTLPHTISEAGGVVLSFIGEVHMRTHMHVLATTQNRYSQAGPYWFDDLKQAYSWPAYHVAHGKGTQIGILMSGSFSQGDMDAYFGHEKLASPKITLENVEGGAPYDPALGGTVEAELDIQQSGGMAPGAQITLYSIPDLSDQSFVAGLVQILEDNKVDVVNMSFGGPEIVYTPEYNGGTDYTGILRAESDFFAEGNALGITFVASSGDFGALDFPPLSCLISKAKSCGTEVATVEFPASSPHVTGVGGTNLGTVTHPKHPDNLDSAYLYEEAFGDPLGVDPYGKNATGAYWGSGGGDSVVFKKPAYQRLIRTGSKVRAVPDIALHMGGCPGGLEASCNPEDSSDVVAVGGSYLLVIGTSASAPDFAGLTALNVEIQGSRLGNENYYIYGLAAAQKAGWVQDVYRDNIPGFNGLYTSGNGGYNRVLGVGTPVGVNFLLLRGAKTAGKPQSPSNP